MHFIWLYNDWVGSAYQVALHTKLTTGMERCKQRLREEHLPCTVQLDVAAQWPPCTSCLGTHCPLLLPSPHPSPYGTCRPHTGTGRMDGTSCDTQTCKPYGETQN